MKLKPTKKNIVGGTAARSSCRIRARIPPRGAWARVDAVGASANTRAADVDSAAPDGVGMTPAARNVQQLELFERRRQRWVDQEAIADRLQAQQRPQEQQRSPGGPRLGTACRRVLDREARLGPRVSGECLRKTAVEVRRRFENSHRDLRGFLAIAVAA